MSNYSINTLIRNLGAAQRGGESLSVSAKTYPRQISDFWQSILGCFGVSKHYAEQDSVKVQGTQFLKSAVRNSPLIHDVKLSTSYKKSAHLLVEDDKGETFWVSLKEITNDTEDKSIQVISETKGRSDYGTVIHTENDLSFLRIIGAPV